MRPSYIPAGERFLLLVLSLILINCLFLAGKSMAEEGKYQRKSVSSLGAALIKNNLNGADNNISGIIENRLQSHLQVPRFDYNKLSEGSLNNFNALALTTDLSPASISNALNNTVIPELQQAVSAVAEIRAKENLTEEQLASAVVEKMKQSGLTSDDISKVLNSAYMYLPVVTAYDERTDGTNLIVTIQGYVLWYKMTVDAKGIASARLLSDSVATATGIGTGNSFEQYHLKNRTVNGADYARIAAVDAWAKNLAVEMKKLNDFKLSAEITNIDGLSAECRIGSKEGIDLDDGFDVVEQTEDENGRVVYQTIGFYRVSQVAENTSVETANQTSRFRNYIGGGIERGAILMERPRLGIDISLRPKYFGMHVAKSDFSVPYFDYWGNLLGILPLINNDISSAFGADLILSGNLAKIVGISQLFLNVEGGIGYPSIDEANGFSFSSPLFYDIYVGLSKKLWFSRMNLELGAGFGYNSLSFKLEDPRYNTLGGDYKFNAYGPKFDAALNYLVNPDLSIGINAGYKITSKISEGEINGQTKTFTNSDTHFSGLSFGFNVSYAISSLPIDPFSFISKGSIDY